MAVHFHTLAIKEVRKETPDCVSILFDVPTALKETFQFEAGQNITIKLTIDGEEIRRSYSICAAPFENELRVAVKKAEQGKFSTYANEVLKAGDMLEVLPPTGKFNTKLQPENRKQYLAFAAGSGITPILGLIKTTLYTEHNSSFTLVYGNRNRNSIVFFEELEAIKNKYIHRFNFINILSQERTESLLNSGRINTEKLTALQALIDYKTFDHHFICGPEAMIFSVKDFLLSEGIDNKKIHFELFTVPGQETSAIGKKQQANEQGNKSHVTVKSDGRSIDFDLAFESETILDAAINQGADLPFACKGGVCCTCKAKLVEGQVAMDVHYGLEQDEIDQGFILTCQSHPLTEKVVIDFDLR